MINFNANRLVISIILFISIAFLTSLTLLRNVEKTEFHGDESGWISSGYYYSNLLLEGDFEWEKWKECPQCGPWGSWYNPHLGHWAIGIPLKVFAAKGEPEFFGFYNFQKSLEENRKDGKIPAKTILFRARSASVVIGILCCLMIFAIGYYSNNLWIGCIAAILLLCNNLFVTLSTQAMTDTLYNFFLLFACLASIFLLRQSRLRHILLISCLYGIFTGLASSVKIIGVVIGGSYFFMVVLYKVFACNLNVKDAAKCFTAFSISTLCIIYLINPYFWPSLKEVSIRKTIQEVATYSKERQAKAIQKENISNQYPQLSNFSHALEFPLMFGRWRRLLVLQLKEDKSAQWGENRLKKFHETFLRESSSFPNESYVLVLGIILLGKKLINSIYRKELSESAVLFLYFGVNYVFILLFMSINYDRYYLPTIIASKIIVAVVIYEAGRVMVSIFRRSPPLISAQRQ